MTCAILLQYFFLALARRFKPNKSSKANMDLSRTGIETCQRHHGNVATIAPSLEKNGVSGRCEISKEPAMVAWRAVSDPKRKCAIPNGLSVYTFTNYLPFCSENVKNVLQLRLFVGELVVVCD